MNTIDLTAIAEETQRAANAAHPEFALAGGILTIVFAIALVALVATIGTTLFDRDNLAPRRLTAAIVLSVVLIASAFACTCVQRRRMDAIQTLQSVCKDEWNVELLSAIGTTDSGSVDIAHDPVTAVVDLAPLAFEARWENADGTIGFGRLTLADDGTLACDVYPTATGSNQ